MAALLTSVSTRLFSPITAAARAAGRRRMATSAAGQSKDVLLYTGASNFLRLNGREGV